MTLTVPVTEPVLARLRERAAELGTTPEAVAAADLARAAAPIGPGRAAARPRPRALSDPPLSREEFRRLLGEMASMGSGKVLPPDFSRADIYDDHD
jgi:hypothetical protein